MSDALSSPPESGGEDDEPNSLKEVQEYESSTDIETDPDSYDSNPEEPPPEPVLQEKKVRYSNLSLVLSVVDVAVFLLFRSGC